MSAKKEKSSQPSRILRMRIFLAGAVTSLVICIVIGIIGFAFYHGQQEKKSVTAGPYYDQKSFQLPEDVKNSTKEATMVTQPIKIPILMYHYVEYVKDIKDIIRIKLDINPAIFEAELKALHTDHYTTYFARDIPDMLNGKIIPSTKTIVLTFDDGYEDFYTDVFPLLKKYQMKATAYIIYDFIGRKGFMTAAQIKEIADSGLVEIGGHTLDHLYLKTIPESVARKQIFDSTKGLENLIGMPLKSFAYPYGAFSQETIDMVKQAGYTSAVSVIPGSFQSEKNLFYLYRIRPGIFSPYTMIQTLANLKK